MSFDEFLPSGEKCSYEREELRDWATEQTYPFKQVEKFEHAKELKARERLQREKNVDH